ncbi:MAG: HEAT repeat domain-containing protein [Alphaproteobacteria bacterium]|nr:HEAT repeat domain-containing protein [Alphaproteobacteria bacterium]
MIRLNRAIGGGAVLGPLLMMAGLAYSATSAMADPLADVQAAPTISLVIDQAYVYRQRASITRQPIAGLLLPLGAAAEDLLLSAGVVVVVGAVAPSTTATLTITGEGEALGGLLFGDLDGYLYTGAQVRGALAFMFGGETAYSVAYAGRMERRRSLERNLGYEDPANAPFADALATSGSFYDRIAEAIGVIYGAPTLIVALDVADPILKPFIARVLGDLGDPVALPALIQALEDSEHDVRWQAAWSLGRLGDPQAVEPLIAALDDRDQDVRWFAAWSLAEITGEQFGDDTEAWLAWLATRPGG